jgi:hypothetical protein
MRVSWNVLSDEQILAQHKTLEPGEYDFQVSAANFKISKTNGNEMIELVLKVWDKNGMEHTLYDYLLFSEKMAFKLKHFWESVGKPENYTFGGCDVNDMDNLCGKLKTILQKSQDNSRMNARVADYVSMKDHTGKTIKTNVEQMDDDIPF